MATSGAGKARSRRSHAPKPYARSGGRKSILSSVTEYLTPSWLKGMWGQDESGAQPTTLTERPNTRGKPAHVPVVHVREDQNGLDEEEEEEEETAVPPVRVTKNRLTHHQDPSVQGSDDARHGPGYFSQIPLTRGSIHAQRPQSLPATSSYTTTYTREAPSNPGLHAAEEDKFSEDSASTSVSFSNVPQVDQSERRSETTTEEVVRDIARPKSLWSEERETRMSVPQQPARSARRPAFNYSVFGSPALNDSSSLFGSPITESPFYEGRTTYGGASAQKHGQKRGRTVSPLQVAPHTMRQQVRPKPASSSRGSGVMSVTAQRILHTLERMSTPISDAKRIPSLTLSTDESPLGFTPSTKKRRVMGGSFLEPGTSRLEGRLAGQPPVQRLNLSTPASIATNRAQTHSTYRPRKSAVPAKEEILVPDSEPATSVARDREPSPLKAISKPASKPAESRPAPVTKPSSQAASTWTPPAQLPIGSGGKIRRERSYGTQRAHAVQDEEEVEVPVLPEIALPIASLPKFDFSPAPSKPLSEGSKVSTTPQVSSVTSSPQFTFASPIVMSSPEDSTPAVSNTETPKFQFSQPASPGKSFPSQGLGTSSAVSAFTGSSTFLTTGAGSGFQPKRKAPEPVVSPSAAASPPPLKQGSVLDALKAEPLPLKSGSVLDALKGGPLVSKPETTKEKLEGRKTIGEGSAAASAKSASLPSLGDQFMKPSGGWDCDTCMVQNTAAASRCVACDTPKPGSQPKLTVPTSVPPVSFGTDAAPKTNGFKLGTTAEGGSANSGFKFGSGSAVNSTSSGFTFGSSSASTAASKQDSNTLGGLKKGTTDFVSTNANTQDASKSIWSKAASGNKWTCDTCLVENKTESTKCAACESPKPGSESKTAASTPAVNFGTSSAFKSTSSSSGSLLAAANNGQKWECQTCLVYNTDDKTKCAACETPKSGSQNKSTPAVGASGSGGFSLGTNSSGLAAAISAQQSKWECETCMVQNDKDATKCLACETPKPGSAQSSSGTGGFQFGSQSTSTGKTASFGSSTGGFQFGAPKPASTETATDAKPQFSGFKFGSGGAESAPSTATSGGLQFGAGTTAASTTPSGGLSFGAGTTATSTGGFTFGAAASSGSGAATTTSNTTSSASGGFTFGTGTTSGAAASGPAATGGFTFGTGSSAAGAAASAGFKFGAGTASQQPDAAPKMTSIADLAKAGQLSVPKPAAGQSTGKRSLESDNSTPAKVNLSSAFGSGTPFGSANPSTAPSFGSTTGANPVFGAGTSAAPSSGLTFGAPAASATGSAAATTSGFTFGTGSSSTAASTTPAPFSFGAGAPPAATTAATASAPFVFGGGASSAPGGSTGGFNFSGGQTASPGPATTAAPSFGTPAFGANPTPASSTPFAPATTAVSGGATPFGGATSFGVQTTSAPSSGPVFGASAAQPAPTAGFNFNAPSQPTFQFGAGSQQSPAVFNFGAAAPAAAAPGGGFNFAAGAGTAAPAPQPAAPFNFSAGAQPGGNPFSIQSTPSASPGGRRVIKKAQRRKR